ncbi:CHAP domain-containing protein [Nocardioides agariphilus]|uniref:CHAP domain-containing protein n=1 Tax=Nocardioides agariphilus TaxID=433664 RepID=A0A930YKM1_9ACTN|nr:CHAP domain-containing protein [Nocardioides agariphilus]
MHVVRPNYAAITRAVRWTVLVLAVLLAMVVVLLAVVTAPARADGGKGPDQTGPDREAQLALQNAIDNGTATGTYVGPFGNEHWVGVFGTHVAAGYGYPYPAAPDCNEGSLGGGCSGDSRGFLQGQCTSWVAYRLAMRNGLSFSNWYAGQHWGNASEWAKVAKGIGHKPDKTPAIGSIGWYKRGHVSYVEDVYSNGTILISEMNTDGHNGFHFATVSPGMRSYPDKFIHLDDVVPVDTTPPTVPTDVRAAAHRGRTGVAWRPSSDAFGVVGYRVFRNGVRLATVRGTSYLDRNPLSGVTAVYDVVAFDGAGHVSSPGRVTVQPGTEGADRAWVSTAAGPAMCGRMGNDRHQRLGCRLLTDSGWRGVELDRTTAWGEISSRAFLPSPDGTVSYCREISRAASMLACTALDPDAGEWGLDRTSGSTPHLVSDATWVTTASGPARCGLTGAARHPSATCTALGTEGWRTATTSSTVNAGSQIGRAFLADSDGSISWCRWLPEKKGARSACISLDPLTMTWGSDSISGRLKAGAPAYPTWVGANAGPASCWSPARDRRGGCRVLTSTGWRNVALPKKATAGERGSTAFITDRSGEVTWCRIAWGKAACAQLSADGTFWLRARATRTVRKLQHDGRTWTRLANGPALCGRAGTAKQPRVACQVLTDAGWRTTTSQTVSWGSPGYRAFVPSGAGAAYCRTMPAGRKGHKTKQGEKVSCTPMTKHEWGVTRTSQRVRLALPDSI